MSYDSNIDAVGAWIDAVIDEIGWDIPAGSEGATHGSGSTMGEAAIDTVIDGIQARALARRGADSLGADDEHWPENTREYRDHKSDLYGEHNPNFRTGQMLSRESLKGQPSIGKVDVVWPYGTGEPPSNAATHADRRRTDFEKAHYAETGQSVHGIRRPFFAITERDADDVLLVAESAIAAHFQRKAT